MVLERSQSSCPRRERASPSRDWWCLLPSHRVGALRSRCPCARAFSHLNVSLSPLGLRLVLVCCCRLPGPRHMPRHSDAGRATPVPASALCVSCLCALSPLAHESRVYNFYSRSLPARSRFSIDCCTLAFYIHLRSIDHLGRSGGFANRMSTSCHMCHVPCPSAHGPASLPGAMHDAMHPRNPHPFAP